MKDRIRQIMESQHMTQQVFAQFLEMSPASLSSIFNDRTKPTLNMVEAIKKKIPDISIDWLMFGKGQMYGGSSSGGNSTIVTPTASSGHVRQANESMLDFDISDSPPPPAPTTPIRSSSTAQGSNSVRNTPSEIVREEIKYIDKPQRRVIEIRVFYDDQTWDTFVPAKK